MSASRKRFISSILLLVGSISSVAGAATGGVIHFEGMIVESPCEVNVKARNVQMACDRDGQVKIRTISFNQLSQAPQGVQNVATMKMNYMNPERTLAILDIVYN